MKTIKSVPTRPSTAEEMSTANLLHAAARYNQVVCVDGRYVRVSYQRYFNGHYEYALKSVPEEEWPR